MHGVTNTSVLLPDNTSFTVKYVGDVYLNNHIVLHDVFYVPSFKFNLLSVSSLLKNTDLSVNFSSHTFFIQDNMQKLIGKGFKQDGLYILQCNSPPTPKNVIHCNNISAHIWHNRLGHPSLGHLQKLLPVINPSDAISTQICYTCPLAKQKKLPFSQ